MQADEKLVDAAERLMLAKGYTATSVEEICAEAGLSKGSFYHHFQTKEAVGLAALEAYNRRARERLMNGPFRDAEDPRRRALRFVDHAESVARELWGDGCLLGNFALELAETKPDIREKVAELWTRSAGSIAEVFEPLPVSAAGAGPSDGRELAEHFLVVLEGAIVMARAHDDWDRVPRGLDGFRHYLELLTD